MPLSKGSDLLWEQAVSLGNLRTAWKRVAQNHGVPGVDGLTVENFATDSDSRLKGLHYALSSRNYRPEPVKTIPLTRGTKTRTISILTVRDRIVHEALLMVLEPLLDPRIPDCVYGYRRGRSAKTCLEGIAQIAPVMAWVFESDIDSFFDSIPINRLLDSLESVLPSASLIELISTLLTSRASCHATLPSEEGIAQGSPLSPLLSNLYLLPLDTTMEQHSIHYYRYADDLLVLGSTRSDVQRGSFYVEREVHKLELRLKLEKTRFTPLAEGVDFLGFSLDQGGAMVSRKAYEGLDHSLLEFVELADDWESERFIARCVSILRGWAQYYGKPRYNPIHDFRVWISFVSYFSQGDGDGMDSLLRVAPPVQIARREVDWVIAASRVLTAAGSQLAALHLLYPRRGEVRVDAAMAELVPLDVSDRERMLHVAYGLTEGGRLTESDRGALIGWAAEQRLFWLADQGSRVDVVEDNPLKLEDGPHPPVLTDPGDNVVNHEESGPAVDELVAALTDWFHGRQDMYAVEQVLADGRRCYENVREPLTSDVWRRHLQGMVTVGQYVVDSNATVRYALFDLDIPKPVWITVSGNETMRAEALAKVRETAARAAGIARARGFPAHLEDSGRRGFHVWFFFEESIPLRMAYRFLEKLQELMGAVPSGLTVERFPNAKKLAVESLGQVIKLPFGIHGVTRRFSAMIQDDGSPDGAFVKRLAIMPRISRQEVAAFVEEPGSDNAAPGLAVNAVRPLYDSRVTAVLKGCSIVAHIVNKAEQTRFLSHSERLLLLHVFHGLGETGDEFVHFVIGHCYDYQRAITQKYIAKSMPWPIRCDRVREKFAELSTFLPCRCVFKPAYDGCRYPSPLRHSGEWPVGEGGTAQGLRLEVDAGAHSAVPGEAHPAQDAPKKPTYTRADLQEALRRYAELGRQENGVKRALRVAEAHLGAVFSELCGQSDRLTLEMGDLVRSVDDSGRPRYTIVFTGVSGAEDV